jgi:hypothetical protein
MKLSKLDWKSLGQIFSMLLNLFTVIRDTLTKCLVGPEIIPWLCGEGNQIFVTEFLEPLGERFFWWNRVKLESDTLMMVNVSAPTKGFVAPPYRIDGPEETQTATWIKVERRTDGLYVEGDKIELFYTEADSSISMGMNVQKAKKGELGCHLLYALVKYPSFIPDDWEAQVKDADPDVIFFTGDSLYVERHVASELLCLTRDEDKWGVEMANPFDDVCDRNKKRLIAVYDAR